MLLEDAIVLLLLLCSGLLRDVCVRSAVVNEVWLGLMGPCVFVATLHILTTLSVRIEPNEC